MIDDTRPENPRRDILPIFFVSSRGEIRIEEFLGTGFLIAPQVFVTCWHCVSRPLSLGDGFYVAVKDETGRYAPSLLSNVGRDPAGSDLATANVELEPQLQLRLAEAPPHVGADVWAFGYPWTESLGPSSFKLGGRYLQGYVMRAYYHEHREFGRTPTLELDMPAPRGLSGSPVVALESKDVVGVVFGENDVATIDQYARVNPATGEREPEIQRVVSFALAHYTDTLRNLRGEATTGRTLAELCSQP
jgi:Trypsin-like peptidase domain